MLNTLKSQIFGLREYEKARIDDRINNVIALVPNIRLQTLEDFEILEECIYKIKEQLRVRSSNLNRVIRDSSFDINKKKVVQLIENLESIRYNFLKKIFSMVQENLAETVQSQGDFNGTSNNSYDSLKPDVINDVSFTEKALEKKEDLVPRESLENIFIFEDSFSKVFLCNGKLPYLLVEFKEDLDFNLLKNLSSHLFENFSCQGTNIVIEDKRALIISRHIGDNLINLPRVESNLDENYDLLINKKKEFGELNNSKDLVQEENVEMKTNNSEIDSEKIDKLKSGIEEEFIGLDESSKKQEFKTRKKEEDSLDELLSGVISKEDQKNKKIHTEKEKEEEKKETIEFLKENDEIEIEKKEKEVKTKNSDVEVELKTPEDKNVEEHIALQNVVPFEIYRDDKIIAYFKHDSKVLGELVISMVDNSGSLWDLNESDLSYISIFSKVFATFLFELTSAHGTNIFWSFNDNSIIIVPRYQEDGINLKVTGEQAKPEFLEQIKNRLLNEMQKEMGSGNNESQQVVKELVTPEVVNVNDSDEMDERAKYILDSLKRIP